MQQSINTRAIILYGLIGIALLGLIIFGISWAKNRSEQVASQPQQQTSQNQQQGGEQQGAQQQDQNNAGNSNNPGSTSNMGDQEVADGQVSGAATTGPTQVPAAGASDWPVFMGAVSVAAFAGAKLLQSRRKLYDLR